jgi:hypothetical protein
MEERIEVPYYEFKACNLLILTDLDDKMAYQEGFEPSTYGFGDRCSTN